MGFLFGKTVGSRCCASIQPVNHGLPGQPVRKERSHTARRKYRSTKTRSKPKNLHRNSPSRRRSTQNRRWSQLKMSLHSEAVPAQMRCKALSRAQWFSKSCVTSCDGLKSRLLRRNQNLVASRLPSFSVTTLQTECELPLADEHFIMQ